MDKKPFLLLAVILALGLSAAAQDSSAPAASPLPKTLGPGEALAVFEAYCASCHDWASSWEGITGGGRIAAGRPAKSEAYLAMETGRMPPGPPAPTPAEIALVKAWIEAGAARPAPGSADGTSGATEVSGAGEDSGASSRFLGFPSKTAYHKASGWASAGLLLAAGTVGVVRALELQSAGHEYRDANGIGEDQIGALCSAEIASLWSGGQALRWTHVGLLVAGEGLYLGNAVTGIGMISPRGEEGVSRSDLHRWAFYLHAALMASEIVLGFVTTDALSRGDHETVSHLGVAHAAIGIAIPLVVLGSGAIEEVRFGTR